MQTLSKIVSLVTFSLLWSVLHCTLYLLQNLCASALGLLLLFLMSHYQANAILATPVTTQLKTILQCGQTGCCAVFVDWNSLFHPSRAAAGLS
jgi:hypothetical protein